MAKETVHDIAPGRYMISREGSNIIYYVDENKKTVVCKMTVSKFSMYNSLSKVAAKYGFDIGDYYDEFIEHTYTGKAKCSPEDTFDLEVGKKIARDRMLAKYYAHKVRFSQFTVDKLSNLLSAVSAINIQNIAALNKYSNP